LFVRIMTPELSGIEQIEYYLTIYDKLA